MVSPAGAQTIKESPRKVYRRAYRDWIERQCLSSKYDVNITGTGTRYWGHGTNYLNAAADTKHRQNFQDVTINLDNKADVINMFNTGTTYKAQSPYQRTIFCRNFNMTRGTINGTIPDQGTDKNFISDRGYSRGFARTASEMQDQVGSTITTSGGSWGGGSAATFGDVGNAHFNAMTEAQLFLTNEGPFKQVIAGNDTNPDNSVGFPGFGGDFADTMNNQFSYLVSAHGGFAYTAGSPTLASNPGGHLRIFAAGTITIDENFVLACDADTTITPNGGGGTIELVCTNLIINKTSADEISVNAKTSGSGVSRGGGGGFFAYANSFDYDDTITNLVSAKGGRYSGSRGDWISEENILLRDSGTLANGEVGITKFYQIEAFNLDTNRFEFQ